MSDESKHDEHVMDAEIVEDAEHLVTREEWAELHKVSIRSARRWGADGEIPGAVRVDGRVMFPAAAERQKPRKSHAADGSVTVVEPLAPSPGSAVATTPRRAVARHAAGPAAIPAGPAVGYGTTSPVRDLHAILGEFPVGQVLDGLPPLLTPGEVAVLLRTTRTMVLEPATRELLGAIPWGEDWRIPAGSIRRLAGRA